MVLVISFKVVMSWDSQDLPGRKTCYFSQSIRCSRNVWWG